MLRVILNIEAGNYYSKSTFIMTLIKENLVFILIILYIQEYFYKIVYGHPGIQRFPISGIRNNQTFDGKNSLLNCYFSGVKEV